MHSSFLDTFFFRIFIFKNTVYMYDFFCVMNIASPVIHEHIDKLFELDPEFIPGPFRCRGLVSEVFQTHVGHLVTGSGVEEDIEGHELI